MKSTLIVMAIVLASGFLVASGAMANDECCVPGPQAQQFGSGHGIDVMGPGYNTTPSLHAAAAGGAATQEFAPAAPRQGIDVMGREYNATPSLDAKISGGAATGEMAPAGYNKDINVMGEEYEKFLAP